MEAQEYESLAVVEDQMWWFQAAHGHLLDAYGRYAASARFVVDAGCGTGGFLRRLRGAAGAAVVCGVDADQGACVAASAKSGACVFRGNVARLPFATGTVDAMFSVDVLCHADVDPPATLVEARRCLRPGGILFLNLPAYMWMRSAHDERVHNSRRFTRAGAAVMLQNAGFGIRAAAYWNALLFPMMATHRLLNRGGHGRRESDVRVFPKPIDRAFRAVLAIERRLIASGLNAPFGGSILVVAVNGG